MKFARVLLLPLLVGLCSSCNRQSDQNPKADADEHAEILARVGDEKITTADFQAEWHRRMRGVPGVAATTEQRGRILEGLVLEKATLNKARAAGQDRNAETVSLINRLIVTRFTEAEFARRFPSEPEIEAAEIASFYENNSDRYRVAPAVRAAVILLKLNSKAAPEQRAAMWERASQLHAEATRANADEFKALVQQNSDDQATRYTGGDTGWLREGQPDAGHPAVKAVALTLQHVGETAPLVTNANGLYIVRLLERQPGSTRPLAEVQEAIRYDLQQQRRQQREQEFFAEMKRGLKIEIDHAALESLTVSGTASNPPPPRLPGS